MTSRTRLLYLDANQLTAVAKAGRGQLILEGEFPTNEQGLEDFAAYLRAHARSVFRLITDLAEESFITESLPRLSGPDRRAVIIRRREQALPGSPFSAAISLGHDNTGGRRQEQFLFFGIHRANLIEPWLKAINDAGVALASLSLVAQSAPYLLSRIDPANAAARALILLRTRTGLRQIFIEQGRLRFSRVTPQSPGEHAPQIWLEEADKTRQYLIRERALNRGEALNVYLIGAHAPNAPNTTLPGLNCLAVSTHTLAAKLGLKPSAHAARDLGAELLALWSAHRQPPKAQLAPPAARLHNTARRIRGGLYALSAACALAATVATLALIHQSQNLTAATPKRTPITFAAQTSGQHTLAPLRGLMQSYDQLVAHSRGPEPLLELLSRALDANPQIELERIEWQATSATRGFAEQLTVSGHLADDTPDMREQLEAVNRLHASLQSTSGVEASLTRLPIDIEPGKTLRSQDAEAIPAGRFAVTVSKPL